MQLYHTYFNPAYFFFHLIIYFVAFFGRCFPKFLRHLNSFADVQPCLCEQINFKMYVSVLDSGKRIRAPLPGGANSSIFSAQREMAEGTQGHILCTVISFGPPLPIISSQVA